MTEFVGRTGSKRVYSYPENPRAAALGLFARNFAVGPDAPTGIDTIPGTLVPWIVIESGAPAGVNVPITPRSTGIIRISGVISVKSSSVNPEEVEVLVDVNGTSIAVPFFETTTVDANGTAVLPILTEVPGVQPIGVPVQIQIRLIAVNTAGVLALVTGSSSLDVQEVSVATG